MSLALHVLDYKILDFDINFIFLLVLIAAIVIFLVLKFLSRDRLTFFVCDSIDVGIKGSTIKIKKTYHVRQIAYSIWTEMNTRTIGTPIDIDNDVIVDVYKSWYEFFSITRNLIKEIPAAQVKKKDTQSLILLTCSMLNDDIRHHLTKWQARFKRWYAQELKKESNNDKSPQEIQRSYAVRESENYDLLLNDLLTVNRKIIMYKQKLEELVFNKILTDNI